MQAKEPVRSPAHVFGLDACVHHRLCLGLRGTAAAPCWLWQVRRPGAAVGGGCRGTCAGSDSLEQLREMLVGEHCVARAAVCQHGAHQRSIHLDGRHLFVRSAGRVVVVGTTRTRGGLRSPLPHKLPSPAGPPARAGLRLGSTPRCTVPAARGLGPLLRPMPLLSQPSSSAHRKSGKGAELACYSVFFAEDNMIQNPREDARATDSEEAKCYGLPGVCRTWLAGLGRHGIACDRLEVRAEHRT
mmetsp:Transcript_51992/g.161352  ORF Transcript_51992/g.161352 Transcript_51992/m.161352 type:complete len:243 (+) Transcript_51992:2063-2791(+)